MHVAIVARALDIPVIGRVAGATRVIEQGDMVVIDGDNGSVLIRPRADIQQSVEAAVAARTRRRAYYETLRDVPAVTRDGVAVELLLNAGLLLDVAQLDATGAAGIGLFRTEIQLLARNTFPDAAEQTEFYRRAYEQAGERPIVFRTLDIGGDKVLPYLPKAAEDNPAMGWRAIRIGLDRPAMLRQPVARAAARRRRARAVRQVPDDQRSRRVRRGAAPARPGIAPGSPPRTAREPRSVSVGVMLEVPALLWQLPALLRRVDFLSVGTNDLAQFLFACDRGNPRLAERYDLLSPPMLALLRHLVRRVRRRRQAAQHLRRDGGQPDRGDGADRARLPPRCRWPRPRSGRSRR